MRWPGKIKPGSVSDEMVHAMDILPTFAKFTGATAPTDRPIDGVDQSKLLLGEQKTSNREGFVVYMGSKVFGVKWKNWKLHFKQLESWAGATQTYEMPKVYNLLADPGETQDVLVPEHVGPAQGAAAAPEARRVAAQVPADPDGGAGSVSAAVQVAFVSSAGAAA